MTGFRTRQSKGFQHICMYISHLLPCLPEQRNVILDTAVLNSLRMTLKGSSLGSFPIKLLKEET
jgi:hypothetical protein